MYECFAFMYTWYHMCTWCPRRSEESDSPDRELETGASTWGLAQVVWKNSQCSWWQSHHSRPWRFFNLLISPQQDLCRSGFRQSNVHNSSSRWHQRKKCSACSCQWPIPLDVLLMWVVPSVELRANYYGGKVSHQAREAEATDVGTVLIRMESRV